MAYSPHTPSKKLAEFPASSRLWIFPIGREVPIEDIQEIETSLQEFVHHWKAHGKNVEAGFEIIDKHFVFLIANESSVSASGCSIDKLFSTVNNILVKKGLHVAPTSQIFFRNRQGKIENISREEFQTLVDTKTILPSTIVFDNTISQLNAYRLGKWALPFSESWHSKAFL